MKEGWRTHAIGRHLMDVPDNAKLIESWKYDRDKLVLLSPTEASDFDKIVSSREAALRMTRHESKSSMFVERVQLANGSVTLISWIREYSSNGYAFDTYFRAGSRIVRYQSDIAMDHKKTALDFVQRCSQKWREIGRNWALREVGFVVGETILEDRMLNLEGWRLVIDLPRKPDVSFEVTAYTQGKAEPGLRERAGGVLAGLLGAVVGVTQLRNHERSVGPIEADEILVAGTQDGKRTYGFKWEAPGKARSLAEPNLNVSLRVGESAYISNNESFSSDEEALELWDAVVGSLRLRPGAV
jgi:hypothetical protein